jgi:hypothetical protein
MIDNNKTVTGFVRSEWGTPPPSVQTLWKHPIDAIPAQSSSGIIFARGADIAQEYSNAYDCRTVVDICTVTRSPELDRAAREVALVVLPHWKKAPAAVKEYLLTGEDRFRDVVNRIARDARGGRSASGHAAQACVFATLGFGCDAHLLKTAIDYAEQAVAMTATTTKEVADFQDTARRIFGEAVWRAVGNDPRAAVALRPITRA